MTRPNPNYTVSPEAHQPFVDTQGVVALNYRGGMGDNREWRTVADDVIARLRQRWDITDAAIPPFTPFEDFVELRYLVAGAVLTLHSDSCLDTIWLTCTDQPLAADFMRFLAAQVGWADR